MKRYLLSVMLCVAACVSAWGYTIDTSKKWYPNVAELTENVAKINIAAAGELKNALADLNGRNYDYQVLYISGLTYDVKTDLNDEDLEALSTVTCATLDLQNLIVANTFTFSNSYIKRVILPDYWDKDAVKAASLAIRAVNTNFEAALSQHAPQNNYTSSKVDAGLVAYVNKPGTLYTALRHIQFDGISNGGKLGNTSSYDFSLSLLKEFHIMGYPSARDMSGGTSNDGFTRFDENGHFVFNVEADENSTTPNIGVGGVPRELIGTAQDGAIKGASLIVLDMEDAVIYDEWNADITVSWLSCTSSDTKEIDIPACPELKTIPADFMRSGGNGFGGIREICIPGNIQIIKTRAFAPTTPNLCHIWTTSGNAASSEEDHTVYDNGAWKSDGTFYTGELDLSDKGNISYGTITLPPNLKVIESHAFFTLQYIKDLYVICEHAPECHVDAFSTISYVANDAYDRTAITDGVIDREAYVNNKSSHLYMTLLHYPRTAGTPDIQRYTDPTRRYSVATGMRDGKGNVIYFPTQTEYLRAYYQGTFGYLWNAWDPTRSTDGNNAVTNPDLNATAGHDQTGGQAAANQAWLDNTYKDIDKSDRSFYDVRLGDDGTVSLSQPNGLEWYYNTIWEDKQLYPERKTFNTEVYYYLDDNGDYVLDPVNGFRSYDASTDAGLSRYSILQEQKTDSEGNLIYESCTEGDYVQDYTMTKDENGDYVHDITVTQDDNGDYVLDYEFVEDNENGTYYHPFAHVSAPADIWNGTYNPSDYWYGNGSYVQDNNGEYVFMWNSTYYRRSDIEGWDGDQTSNLQTFDNLYAEESNRYKYVVSSYTQCTDRNSVSQHSSNLYQVGTGYAVYSSDVTDVITGVNDTKYRRENKDTYRAYDASIDAGETRYDVEDNGYRTYDASTDEGKDRYSKSYIANSYRLATSTDDASEPRYCPVMQDVERASSYTVSNDYRGWHQFVLTAYATNSDEEFIPLTLYQTDNDWWTICFPFDLTYSDMIKFFGNGEANIPYLSKLTYVVRDYGEKKITLMFSKNLMEYKETVEGDYVHGTISTEKAKPAADDVVLHKGVPYLIRPNIAKGASRQFDVYKKTNEGLYNRMLEAQNLSGADMNQLIYNGEYTVPAYIVNDESGKEKTVDSKSITMENGPTFNYANGTITYHGKEVDYKISSEFTYTFVGSYFLSLMPQYSYFLGWDSNKEKAAFWYNKTPDPTSWSWNNETGIICPNFKTDLTIHAATGLDDPARWIITADTEIFSDDLNGVTGAKSYTMDFGGDMGGIVDGIDLMEADNAPVAVSTAVYDLQGVKRAQSLGNLPKGIYIVNGKKYVVK